MPFDCGLICYTSSIIFLDMHVYDFQCIQYFLDTFVFSFPSLHMFLKNIPRFLSPSCFLQNNCSVSASVLIGYGVVPLECNVSYACAVSLHAPGLFRRLVMCKLIFVFCLASVLIGRGAVGLESNIFHCCSAPLHTLGFFGHLVLWNLSFYFGKCSYRAWCCGVGI